jgi:glycine cleavage system aminomethyltransferase T
MNKTKLSWLYTLRCPFGAVIGDVVLFEAEDYRILAHTQDGGKAWVIAHEEKGNEKRK